MELDTRNCYWLFSRSLPSRLSSSLSFKNVLASSSQAQLKAHYNFLLSRLSQAASIHISNIFFF
jgi:hypothetical protein